LVLENAEGFTHDKGILTLGDSQQVDFSKTMVFMTSNLGASEMQHAADETIGFVNNIGNKQENLTAIAMNAARKRFSPVSQQAR
jgi:ATP-dependent Clp protease ATP-binding subunit ClpA